MTVRFMRACLAAAVALPATGAAQGGSDPQPIALADAVRLAQRNSPTTVQARNAERGSEQSVRSSMAAFFPTLSLSAASNQRGGTQFVNGNPLPISGQPWSYSRGLNTSVNLFDGGQRWNQYKTSLANVDRDASSEVTARYSVALNVKTQYFQVLAARETESAARRQLEQAQQQLKVAATKMAAGAATRADSLASAIAVGNARLAILNAQNSLGNANAGLTRLIASPIVVTAVASDTSVMGAVTIDEAAISAMVLEGPAVKQAQATLVAAQAAHKASTSTYLPSLQLTGSYSLAPKGSDTFNWGGGPTTTSTNLGFSLNYTIFNNFTRETQLVNARITEDNAEASLRDAKFGARQNLTTFVNNFSTAQQRVELQLLTITQADEALRVVQQRYNLGTAQLLEVLQAQTTLDNARAALIQARLDARTAKANIEQLIGRDLP